MTSELWDQNLFNVGEHMDKDRLIWNQQLNKWDQNGMKMGSKLI